MIDPTIWVAAISASGAMVSPLFLAFLLNRNAREFRDESYRRQDEQAAAAAEAVRHVASQAEEAARLLVLNNKLVVKTTELQTEKLSGKLDVIHGLVNSQLTATMQAELDATVHGLASLKEIIQLKKEAGHDADCNSLQAIKEAETRIAELRTVLKDRTAAQSVVESQSK